MRQRAKESRYDLPGAVAEELQLIQVTKRTGSRDRVLPGWRTCPRTGGRKSDLLQRIVAQLLVLRARLLVDPHVVLGKASRAATVRGRPWS